MAEFSRPWSGIITGDSGPYSDDQWTDTWLTLAGPIIASEGVFNGQLLELDLSNVVSPVSINTGRALVDGTWYESSSAVTKIISTPSVGNNRIDRIVLRKDWALATVRLTVIAGAEAASPVPPVIIQVDQTTWDLPLWQVRITDGGVITHWRDERSYLGQYEPAGYSTVDEWYEQDDFGWPILVFDNTNDNDSVRGWTLSISAGAGNTIQATSVSGRAKGFISLAHGVGINDDVLIRQNAYRPDQGNARFLLIAKEPNTNANIDRLLGLSSGAGSLIPGDGVMFRNDGSMDSNWHAVTRTGGAETDTDTLIALSNTFKKLEIQWRSNASVTFLINDLVVATHETDIPVDVSMAAFMGIFDNAIAPVSQAYQDLDLYKFRGNR